MINEERIKEIEEIGEYITPIQELLKEREHLIEIVNLAKRYLESKLESDKMKTGAYSCDLARTIDNWEQRIK